jgi:hypothetical protein
MARALGQCRYALGHLQADERAWLQFMRVAVVVLRVRLGMQLCARALRVSRAGVNL